MHGMCMPTFLTHVHVIISLQKYAMCGMAATKRLYNQLVRTDSKVSNGFG